MSVTKTYNRLKSTTVNSTGIVVTVQAAEKPNSPHVFRDTDGSAEAGGTTGNVDVRIKADADESGGTDVQDLFKVETAISVDTSSGVITLVVTTTPVKGDGTTGTAVVSTITHDENFDVWQTGAGRARQS